MKENSKTDPAIVTLWMESSILCITKSVTWPNASISTVTTMLFPSQRNCLFVLETNQRRNWNGDANSFAKLQNPVVMFMTSFLAVRHQQRQSISTPAGTEASLCVRSAKEALTS